MGMVRVLFIDLFAISSLIAGIQRDCDFTQLGGVHQLNMRTTLRFHFPSILAEHLEAVDPEGSQGPDSPLAFAAGTGIRQVRLTCLRFPLGAVALVRAAAIECEQVRLAIPP